MQQKQPFLLRDPSVSKMNIAFGYGGCIWIANHEGAELRRLTTAGREFKPAISPDGTNVAFIGEYGGPRGVFVMPIGGGEPRRLTFHPADLGSRICRNGDTVGWTPDGARILFSSRRDAFTGGPTLTRVRLFTVPAEGGPVTALPLARAVHGVLSPDERRIAYIPHIQSQPEWKHYRGGQASFITIADLADSCIVDRIPRDGSNDFSPIWVRDTLYFLSDRAGPVTLFAYDLKSRQVRQVVKNNGLDIKAASVWSDIIVYEQFGSLHLLDVKSGRERNLDIQPVGDFPEIRSHLENAAEWGPVEGSQEKIKARLSPSGTRVVFDVRGRVVTVPAQKGDIRVLTQSPGVAERDPAWSPDGKSIAYFSDESGEYALHVRESGGGGIVKKISLGDSPTFYYSPLWSPDSKKIAYGDKRLNYWYLDVGDGTPVRFDTAQIQDCPRNGGGLEFQMAWSPDSRWIAYTKQLPSHLHAVFVHSIERGKNHQLTDGMSDARDAAFDRGGQYLYFTASTDVGMSGDYADMNGYRRPTTRSVHAILLRRDTLPLLPIESDEEEGQVARGGLQHSQETAVAVEIDLEEIDQRLVRLPVPPRNYYGLWAGRSGIVYLTEGPQVESSQIHYSLFSYALQKVHRLDLHTRCTDLILDDAVYFDLSFAGDKMIYARQGDKRQWFIAAAEKPAYPAQGLIRMGPIEILVDPRREWRQMYEEVWRQQRDFFYDPGLHGMNLQQVKKTYEPFLANIVTREELEYLFNEMLANLACSHIFRLSGELGNFKPSMIGLLGADYTIDSGRYRFSRIYDSDPWSAHSHAPLCEPGRKANVGEYLLAVNDHDVRASADVYSYFAGTAGKQIVIKVGPKADGAGSREIRVIPIQDEYSLRYFAWLEANRRKVEELTDGRVAYIHIPDLTVPGYEAFNRQFFAQVGKDAVIVDARYNGGGSGSDYIIECLRRPLTNYWHVREGRDRTHPLLGIFGPKVMLINEMSGSMAERLPWTFRQQRIGPLIGKRTWGGLVGSTLNAPDLLDGGWVTTPNLAFYNLQGAWEVENHGVSPDIEVDDDPKAARLGSDLQLERAVEVVMDLLQRNPPPSLAPQHPPYPHYYREK